MNQREARSEGFGHGYDAAIYCEVSAEDRQQAGCGCQGDAVCSECLTSAAFESEQNARQFSPWEFLAHDINECGDRSEGLWEAYDAGVASGIKRGVRERLARKAS
jgi:hypothetical protein